MKMEPFFSPPQKSSPQATRIIYCMGCEQDVEARLSNGAERYPHRPDLANIPFWTHDACGTWVGTHHKTSKPTRPLGILATPEMFRARTAIHDILDPIWKSGVKKRGQVYAHMARELGYQYHTGEIRTMDEARRIWRIAADYYKEVMG